MKAKLWQLELEMLDRLQSSVLAAGFDNRGMLQNQLKGVQKWPWPGLLPIGNWNSYREYNITFPPIDRYLPSANILADMVEIIRANKKEVQSTNELIQHTPQLVAEALDLLGSTNIKTAGTNLDQRIDYLFDVDIKPTYDLDREGYLRVLGLAILGHSIEIHSDIYEKKVVSFIKNRLETDERKWGDTWKHKEDRPVAGQLERTYSRFRDYRDAWKNGGERFPWLKVAGEAIISLVRIDHPEYQK